MFFELINIVKYLNYYLSLSVVEII